MITPRRIRIIAPIRIAITDVSPMVPGIFPVSISMTLTEESPSFLIMASGVAPEYASNCRTLEICHVCGKSNQQETSSAQCRVHEVLSQSAKQHLYNYNGKYTCQSQPPTMEDPAGRFSARRSPVTTALRSGQAVFLVYDLIKNPFRSHDSLRW